MMRKILFFTLGLLMATTSFGQASSDTLQNANDSVIIALIQNFQPRS